MGLSRRSFLQRTAAGAGAAAILRFPLELLASPEPQRAQAPAGVVRINSNENAYGPLPAGLKAMQDAVAGANRYPDFGYRALVSQIASWNKIKEEQVLLGVGSSEIIRMCALAFARPGKNIVTATPTFEFLGQFAKANGAEMREVPLTSTYAHDLDGMLQRTDANTSVIYICNANNPTASITPDGDITAFLNKVPGNTLVMIDEAYHHLSVGMPGYATFMEAAGDRVIVLRTFSKVYGMAGMRLGYGVTSPAMVKKLRSYAVPININVAANAGGIASLQADDEMKAAAQRIAGDRAEFTKQAAARKATMIPSYANFAMIKTGRPAKDVIAGFEKQNVLIGRPFPPMLDWVRVTFGQPDEMKTFWAAWDELKLS
jgi:histidinol-phosphate aminotransferase